MVVAVTSERAIASAVDVARYFLLRVLEIGDYITNLKMQKLVYYAYGWTLVKHGQRLFDEPIQAWPSGPVVPELYALLSRYGSAPIGDDFLATSSREEIEAHFPPGVLQTLGQIYEFYGIKSAFELAVSTQQEKPWVEARRGLSPTDASERVLDDHDIEEAFPAIIMEELL